MSIQYLVPKERMPWRHLLCYGWMPSFIKVWAYRHFLGYKIGRGVRIGVGGVVVGQDVEIGEQVHIGFLTVIRGRVIKIGRHTQIGSTSYLMCEAIDIGEDAKINEQVFVGGPMLPDSYFRLGSRTIVMQMSFLNPTRPLIIGDDSGIGGHCLIFTHGSWLNALDGYPVSFAPVTIGKSVWLPWRVFVMPGASIGDGSVIGADALVQGAIPPSSLAVGSPAKVIRTAPDFPKRVGMEEQAQLVEGMLEEFDRFVRANGTTVDSSGAYARGGRLFRLVRLKRGAGPLMECDSSTVVFAETPLSPGDMENLRRTGTSWLDLGGRTRSQTGNPLCEELALFLSRYGIRLRRDG